MPSAGHGLGPLFRTFVHANVLINDRYEACLCDFGLSRFLVDSTLVRTTVAQAEGTLRWMSPELMLRNQGTPTKESDIYAYAMTCYEIITCDIPFKSVRNEANLIYNVTVEKQRPEHVESRDLDGMWDIITKCWAEEPGDRPRTAEVLQLVQQRKENSGSLPLSLSFSIGQTHHSSERLGSGPELAAEEPRTGIKTGQVTRRGDGGTSQIGTEISAMIQPKRYSSAPTTAWLNLLQGKIHILDLTGQIECTTEVVGNGGYSYMYKGKWVEEAVNAVQPPIVVKVNLLPSIDERHKKRLSKQIKRELEVWSKIDHKNILPLLGIAYINLYASIPAFISPWMENGSAKQFRLRNPFFPPLLILYDIIQGLHYLHTLEPEIVHGDIKAVNVLINGRYEACLCNFGLSRPLTDSTLWKTTATQAGGTLRWMSPELMTGKQSIPTKESDIYAYAMTCYEILSGDVPFKSVRIEANLVYIVPVEKQRPEHVESCDSYDMWDIITKCWAEEPEGRPRTAEVLELVKTIHLPPQPSTRAADGIGREDGLDKVHRPKVFER
ncbi:Protein kinase-like domain containing protein [Amanita muscaria]